MAKSIQDLCIYMNSLKLDTNISSMSIEIFEDKSFIIWDTSGDEPQSIYNSSEKDEAYDINDLCYYDISSEILADLSVRDIKAEDL